MGFGNLGLSDKTLTSVERAGFVEPTPIQSAAIPAALAGRDVLGIAQTGTGKTAAFVLPMLTRLEAGRARARMPRSLIMEPTRELAAQVAEAFEALGGEHRLNVALLIGGVSFVEQNRVLDRGADVLIATPGRLLDHFERGRLLLTAVDILVIDEADRMLDMGFIPDVERICKLIPFTRQTLFFSATMPPEIQRLTQTFLQAPARAEVAPPASASEKVEQYMLAAPSSAKDKRALLRRVISASDGIANAIIFCNRKRDVTILFNSCKRHGLNVGALHGDMDQHARMDTLERFRDGRISLLVASDVAARGLDIPAVSHVFNYDVPTHAEDYVHRIGRTGRAGRSGKTVMLVERGDDKYVRAITNLIGTSIASLDLDSDADPNTSSSSSSSQASSEKPARSQKGRTGARQADSAPKRRSRTKRSKTVSEPEDGMQSSGSAMGSQSDVAILPAEDNKLAQADGLEDDGSTGVAEGRKRNKSEAEQARESFGKHSPVPAFLLRPVRKKGE